MLSNVFLFLPVYIWIIIDLESRGLFLSVSEYSGFVVLAVFILFVRFFKKVIK
jgi:hypothetical protein